MNWWGFGSRNEKVGLLKQPLRRYFSAYTDVRQSSPVSYAVKLVTPSPSTLSEKAGVNIVRIKPDSCLTTPASNVKSSVESSAAAAAVQYCITSSFLKKKQTFLYSNLNFQAKMGIICSLRTFSNTGLNTSLSSWTLSRTITPVGSQNIWSTKSLHALSCYFHSQREFIDHLVPCIRCQQYCWTTSMHSCSSVLCIDVV